MIGDNIMIKLPLKLLRLSCGKSTKELAEGLNISERTLEKYENNTGLIPVSILVKIRRLYGIPLELIYIGKHNDCIEDNLKYVNTALRSPQINIH